MQKSSISLLDILAQSAEQLQKPEPVTALSHSESSTSIDGQTAPSSSASPALSAACPSDPASPSNVINMYSGSNATAFYCGYPTKTANGQDGGFNGQVSHEAATMSARASHPLPPMHRGSTPYYQPLPQQQQQQQTLATVNTLPMYDHNFQNAHACTYSTSESRDNAQSAAMFHHAVNHSNMPSNGPIDHSLLRASSVPVMGTQRTTPEDPSSFYAQSHDPNSFLAVQPRPRFSPQLGPSGHVSLNPPLQPQGNQLALLSSPQLTSQAYFPHPHGTMTQLTTNALAGLPASSSAPALMQDMGSNSATAPVATSAASTTTGPSNTSGGSRVGSKRKRAAPKAKDPIDCQKCDKNFSTQSLYKRHMKNVHAPKTSTCKFCSKAFSNKQQLALHQDTVHLNKKNFVCNICNKAFGHKHHVTTHIRTVHMRLKDFKCNFCSYECGQRGHLTIHINTVHLQKTNFKCEHCPSEFARKETLLKHVATVHLGRKDHKCQYCDKAYGHKSSLTTHMSSVHPEKMKHLECKVCHIRCKSQAALAKHHCH